MALLIQVAQSWQPHLIVHEKYELAGAITAKFLGLPHAMLQVTFSSDWRNRPDFAKAAAERLDELRRQYGLSSDPHLEMIYRHLVLAFDPSPLLDPAQPVPANTHFLLNTSFDRSSNEALTEWFSPDLPRPLIYVTLGTEAPKIPAIYPAILEGLRNIEGTVILTVGRDPADLGPTPPHESSTTSHSRCCCRIAT